jgi:hypothetical protein
MLIKDMKDEFLMDISHLASGIYFLHSSSGGLNTRFVKMELLPFVGFAIWRDLHKHPDG